MSERESLFSARDVIRALLELANQTQGGKAVDEMPPDSLCPHSNAYSFWFIAPGSLRFGTAPLTVDEIAERVERRLGAQAALDASDSVPRCAFTVPESLTGLPDNRCLLPLDHKEEHEFMIPRIVGRNAGIG